MPTLYMEGSHAPIRCDASWSPGQGGIEMQMNLKVGVTNVSVLKGGAHWYVDRHSGHERRHTLFCLVPSPDFSPSRTASSSTREKGAVRTVSHIE